MIPVRTIALLGLLLAGIAPAVARIPTRTVRTAHFAITHPVRADVGALGAALEAGYRRVREYGLRLPPTIEVRVHATTQEFAARSGAGRMHLATLRGATLHLQPTEVLRRHSGIDRALAHELVHVALAPAATRMPRWLFEGVAMTIAGEMHPVAGAYGSTAELDRALADARAHQEARRAYGAAERLTRRLVARVGQTRMPAVLRAILNGADAADALRTLAGVELEAWAIAELGVTKWSRTRGRP